MLYDTVVIFSDSSAHRIVCLLVVAFFGGQRLLFSILAPLHLLNKRSLVIIRTLLGVVPEHPGGCSTTS